MKKSISWGNYPKAKFVKKKFSKKEKLENFTPFSIAFGNGRSYGDSCISDHIVTMNSLNKIEYFNESSGMLIVESGVLLSEIIARYVGKGWFPNVVPGTKFVTVGGAIASDIHGKNHHSYGCFSECIYWLELMLPSGEIIKCSELENQALFRATCGGMGLTGFILKASLQLKKIPSAFINQQIIRTKNLKETFTIFEQTKSTPYSVAWIDCLAKKRKIGRSVIFLGDFIESDKKIKSRKKIKIPTLFPSFVLNDRSIKAFNSLYYLKNRSRENEIVDYETFFFPLDSILNWNRIYGHRGFLQYQFIIPLQHSFEGISTILNEIASSKHASFLSVLKLYGNQNKNYLSFPIKGYSLALDFKIKKGLFDFLNSLDAIVAKYGGRVYLTKDARMKASFFHQTYEKTIEFNQVREKFNLKESIQSLQSKRLNI